MVFESTLQFKFRASILKAVPSIHPAIGEPTALMTRSNEDRTTETYIMGGFVKIHVDEVQHVDRFNHTTSTKAALRISIPVYKVGFQEFNTNELSFLVSWAQSGMQIGEASIQDEHIMMCDEVPLECLDNYSHFCAFIDRLLESYWSVRGRVLDAKEDLIRRELQRMKRIQQQQQQHQQLRQQEILAARRRKHRRKRRRFPAMSSLARLCRRVKTQ